jgi:hypothetical protein
MAARRIAWERSDRGQPHCLRGRQPQELAASLWLAADNIMIDINCRSLQGHPEQEFSTHAGRQRC